MIVFPQAFPLIPGTRQAAVKWSKPENCRPSDTFAPDETYGMPTGPRNGMWVLDLDRKNGKDGVREMDALGEFPPTRTVVTPSGGIHMYWLWEDARPVRFRIGLLPGVDVPVAVFAGEGYRVIKDTPPAPAPQWLVDFVGTRARGETGESAVAIDEDHPEWSNRVDQAQRFLASEPPCIEGQGTAQGQIWKIALRIMRTYELPVETALYLLSGGYNARCVPPWSEDELRRTLLRAAEEGHGPTGTFAGDFLARGESPQGGRVTLPAPEKVPGPTGPEGEKVANFLDGEGEKVALPPAPEEKKWRQTHDPDHEYTFDVSAACAGAMVKTLPLGPKELTGSLSGPGAFPSWCGVWQYDAFRRRVIAVNPPMHLDADIARGGPGISNRDLASMAVWFSCNGGKVTKEQVSDAINVAARSAEHHPVREYLAALPVMKSGVAREYFTGIAGRLWGADEERDALESGHLMRLAIAAVRRIRFPGTKVDTMLVLAGEQGFRKSIFCEYLFSKPFFLDQLPPIASGRGHEASIAIEGRWGVEIAEMNALAHAHESAKKEFLTRCTDKYRPVFGIAMQEVPRQCVFIGTTNDDDFLTDPTGDTRYDICAILEPIRLDLLNRDEFWAAAVALEAAGESHYRDRALLARAGKSGVDSERPFFGGPDGIVPPTMAEGAAFASEDVWTEEVLSASLAHAVEMPGGGEWITAKGAMKGLNLAIDRQDSRSFSRVKGVLRRAYGAALPKWLEGRVQRCYLVRGSPGGAGDSEGG